MCRQQLGADLSPMQKEGMNFGEKFATATRFVLSDCLYCVMMFCDFGLSIWP